ncbi:MAG: cupin domain-containing protein [Chloroflexi bacterium]|nr:cupin domain-containing protein [Chloroflexota bacterium]
MVIKPGSEEGEWFHAPTPYEEWEKAEGLPIVRGHSIDDLRTVPVKPWPRKGGMGALIRLEGSEDSNDSYVCEIPPGGTLKPQRHLFEEVIFVIQGRGATTIWTDGGAKQTFEWQEGSLFSPPLNVWHQHFNGQGDKPARFMGITNRPVAINLYRNLDFIYNNPFVFKDRYGGGSDYFSGQGKLQAGRVWESNFIPDVHGFKLYEWKTRGAGGTNIMFEMSSNFLRPHISEFPVGTYKKGHRHGPGAHVIILNGEGYSLIWPAGSPPTKIDWRKYSLFVPPDDWYHQHFNVGSQPARYLAITWGTWRVKMTKVRQQFNSAKEGGNQIEYADESPEIRKLFQAELARKGLKDKMDSFFPKR